VATEAVLEPSPEEHAVAASQWDALRSAVASLPGEQRRALVLVLFHGRTAQDVSELEGVPLGTAKTRIRAAMLKLRAALVAEDA